MSIGRLFFAELQAQDLKLGLATMDSAKTAHDTVNALDLNNSLAFVCGADSGYGAKPDAGMVHAFCRQTSLASEQVAVVGDSPPDLAMARNAGCAMAIAVLSGTHGREELQDYADVVVNSVAELPRLLA